MQDNLDNNFNGDEKLVKTNDYTDFPFQNISFGKWIISLIILFSSFILVEPVAKFINPIAGISVFVLGSIVALLVLDLKFFPKLFKIPKFRDILTIIFTLVLTFVLAIAIGQLFVNTKMEANPVFDIINDDNFNKFIALIAAQLIFEEIQFVIPFLFIYNMFRDRNRTLALILAWLISSEIFGLLHLQTYSYNLVQCMVMIPAVRFGITYSYVKTKNLFVAYVVHFLWDLILISLTLFAVNNGLI